MSKPTPMLTTPDHVGPVLDAWRKPSMMSGGALVYPDDATKRTLTGTIEAMPAPPTATYTSNNRVAAPK